MGRNYNAAFYCNANVAKLVDALDLGSSGNPVGVRVSPFAPILFNPMLVSRGTLTLTKSVDIPLLLPRTIPNR